MKRFAALVLMILLLSCETAFAEGFALYEYSARSVALGGATMARKPDPSAVASNPALITKLKGAKMQVGFSAITPDGKMDTWDSAGNKETTNLKPSTWWIPHAYYTQQISDNWYFGIGEFSRFGLGFEYPHDWPGRFNIYQVKLTSASLNPNIAWAVTDKLSLAAGLEIVYVDLDMKKRVQGQLPPQMGGFTFEVDSSITEANDIAPGFNLAAHYQFSDQWAAGLSYRSQVRVHARGDVDFTYMGSNAPNSAIDTAISNNAYGPNFNDGGADAIVILPDSIAGGISWTPIPQLSFEAGAIWTRWSSFRSLNIHLPEGMQDSKNRKDWKNTWRLNFGVEWQALDWLALRAGYVYDQSPMTNQYADYLVPTDDRSIYSVGVGLKYNAWTLDLTYAYIDARGRSYGASDETHVLKSKAKNTGTDVVSVSLTYEF